MDEPRDAKRGGGAMWTSYTLDPQAGELFVPGEPVARLHAERAAGDNLFSNSVWCSMPDRGAQVVVPGRAQHGYDWT